VKIFVAIVGFLIVILFSIWMWSLARAWNYNLSYKSMVKQTIVDMVREDCLRNPSK
jgi:cytoskeletal protein RodZ